MEPEAGLKDPKMIFCRTVLLINAIMFPQNNDIYNEVTFYCEIPGEFLFVWVYHKGHKSIYNEEVNYIYTMIFYSKFISILSES